MIESEEEIDEFLDSTHSLKNDISKFRGLLDDALDSIEDENNENGSEKAPDDNLMNVESGNKFMKALVWASDDMEGVEHLPRISAFYTINGMCEDIVRDIELINEKVENKDLDSGLSEDFIKEIAKQNFLSDDYLNFYAISFAMLEDCTIGILKNKLIDDEYIDSNKTATLLQRWTSQREREQWLLRTGILDEGTVGEMKRIRKTRNNLTHELSSTQNISRTDITKSDFDRTINTVENLLNMLESISLSSENK